MFRGSKMKTTGNGKSGSGRWANGFGTAAGLVSAACGFERGEWGRGWSRVMAGALVAAACVPAFAGPEGEQVVRGNVNITRDGATTLIRASDRAIINYRSFDVRAGESVRFLQPSASARVLNRITTAAPTRIDGNLSANGRVYFVNPAGVFFGRSSVVDVGGLVVAAGRMSDQDFVRGIDRFSNVTGSVVNEGQISGGFAALIGSHVRNAGTIVAPQGTVIMGSAEEALIGKRDGNVFVRLTGNAGGAAPAGSAAVENTGTVDARGGAVVVAAGDVYSMAVRSSGTIRGRDIKVQGQGTGIVSVEGRLDASSATGKGGSIEVTGQKVGAFGATIDASGAKGGGQVNIGGGLRGQGDLRRAEVTAVNNETTIRADATGNGDGGQVVVWSDQTTRFYGNVSTKSAGDGKGGLVETSSKGGGVFAPASIDTGERGTWLIDPRNVTIDAVATSGGAFDGGTPNTFTPSADDAIADVATINSELTAGGDVVITTSDAGGSQDGNITVDAAIAKTGGGTATLTLLAAGTIQLNADISSTAGQLNVVLTANDAGQAGEDPNTGAGDVNFSGQTINNNGGSLTATGVNINAGTVPDASTVTLTATVGVSINAPIDGSAGVDITAPGGIVAGGTASITTDGGVVTLNNSLEIDAGFQIDTTDAGANAAGANIFLNGVTSVGSAQGITLVAGTGGAVDVNGAAGSGADPLGGFTVSSADTVTTDAITSNDITVLAGTSATFAGTLTAVNHTNITIDADSVTAAAITATDDAGGDGGVFITIDNAGSLDLQGNVTAPGGFSQVGTGTVTLGGDLTTVGADATSDGDVSFGGDVTASGNRTITAGAGTVDFNGNLGIGNTIFTVSADEIEFDGGDDSVTGGGTATLVLQPGQAATPMNVGNGADNAGELDLRAGAGQDLAAITNDFGSFIFGSTTQTSTLTLTNGLSLSDPATFRTAGGGSISGGTLTGTGNASFVFNGPTTIGAITTNNGAVRFQSTASLGGDITVTGGNSAAFVQFDGATTTTAPVTIDTGDGVITIGSTFGAGANALNLVAGEITLSNALTGSSTLGIRTSDPAMAIVVAGTPAAAQLDLSAAEVAFISGFSGITIGSNAQTANTTIGGAVSFADPVTFDTDTGTILVSNALTGTGDASFTFDGATTIGADIVTANQNVTFNGAATLSGNRAVTAGSGSVDFNSTLALGGTTFTVSADEIDFDGGDDSVTGSGATAVLQPGQNTTVVNVGNAANNAGQLDLTAGTGEDIAAFANNFGVFVFGSTTQTAAMNLTGGLSLRDAATFRTAAGGSITGGALTGTDNASFVFSGPTTIGAITTNNGAVRFTSTALLNGDITITGGNSASFVRFDGATTTGAAVTIDNGDGTTIINSTFGAGANPLVIRAGEVDLAGALSGTDALTIATSNIATPIVIAGTAAGGQLDLTAAELAFIADGFSGITIGGSGQTANTTIGGAAGFTDPLTFDTDTGSILVSNALTGTGDASFTFDGPTTISANVTTANQNVTFNAATTVGATATVNAGTALVDFNSTLGLGNNAFTVTADEIDFDGGDGSVTGGGSAGVVLQPSQDATPMNVGNAADNGGELDLTAGAGEDLDAFANNFGTFTLGSTTQTSTLTLTNGLSLRDPTTFRVSGTGSISGGSLTGIDNASFVFNGPTTIGSITTNNGSLRFLGTASLGGDITVTGGNSAAFVRFDGATVTTASSTINAGDGSVLINSTFDAGANDLALVGGEVDLANTLSGTGLLTIRTNNVATATVLGGTATAGRLDLTTAEIAQIADGFTAITIGGAAHTASTTVENSVSFSDPVAFEAGTGTVVVDAAVAGTGNASITFNADTDLGGQVSTANQPIVFNSPVTVTANVPVVAGTSLIEFADTLALGVNTLSLQADTIDLSAGANSVTGGAGSAIAFQPGLASGGVGLFGAGGTLQLTSGTFAAIAPSVADIVIGRSDGTGAINVDTGTITSDVTFIGGGTVTVNGAITGTGFDFQAPAAVFASITANGGGVGSVVEDISFADLTVNANTSLTAAGTVTFGGNTDINGNDLTITAEEVNLTGGNDSFSSTGGGSLLTISSTGDTLIAGAADTSATVLDFTVIDRAAIADNFGSYLFAPATGQSIGIGTVSFRDPVEFSVAGGGTTAVAGTLTGTDNASFRFTGTTLLESSITTADGFIRFAGTTDVSVASVVTSGGASSEITLVDGNPINLNSSTLTLVSNDIDLGAGNSTVAGSGVLVMRPLLASDSIGVAGGAGTLDISQTDLDAIQSTVTRVDIGTATTGTHDIVINAATFNSSTRFLAPAGGTITVGQSGIADTMTVASGDLTFEGFDDGVETTFLNADILTSGGTVTVNDDARLGDDVIIDTTNAGGTPAGGDVEFNGFVIGDGNVNDRDLAVTTGTAGAATFTDDVGGTGDQAVGSLLVNGASSTVGNVTFRTVGGAISDSVDFNGTLDSTGDVTVVAGLGDVIFRGEVGGTAAPTVLLVSSAAHVTTTTTAPVTAGQVDFTGSDNVAIQAPMETTAGGISLTSSAAGVVVSNGGTLTTANSDIVINGVTVATLNGDVDAGTGDVQVTAAQITLGGVTSADDVTATASSFILVNGQIDADNSVGLTGGSVDVNAPVNTGTFTSTGTTYTSGAAGDVQGTNSASINHTDAVLLAGDVRSDNGSVTIAAGNDGTGDLSFNASRIGAPTISMTAGNGTGFAIIDAVSNAPIFTGPSITSVPNNFSMTQDADWSDGVLPAASQFGGAFSISNDPAQQTQYSLTSSNGSITLSPATDATKLDNSYLTLNASSISIGGSISPANLLVNGALTITDAVTLTAADATNGSLDFTDTISVLNDATLRATEINFAGAITATGAPVLALRPVNDATAMQLGAASDSGATVLDITAAELAFIGSGFSELRFGSPTGTGGIIIAGPVTFDNNVSFLGTSGGVNVGGDLRTNGQTISFDDVVIISGDVDIDTTNNGAVPVGANIDFADEIVSDGNANDRDLAIASGTAGAITFGGDIGGSSVGDEKLGSLQVSGDSTFSGGTSVRTVGAAAGDDISFNGNVNGTGALSFEALASGQADGGDVTFNGDLGNLGAVTSVAAVGQNITVRNVSTTGGQTYTNNATNNTGTTTISSSGGTATYSAAGGNVIFNGDTVLAADAIFNGQAITFARTLNSDGTARSLTANSSGSGNTSFGGAVGATSALSSVTTNADGTVEFAADVTTTGAQTYNEAASTTADADFTSTSGDVTFASALVLGGDTTVTSQDATFGSTINSDGIARDLTVNTSGSGATAFGGAIGGSSPLASLTTNADGTVSFAGNVSTSGAQSYADNATTSADATFSAASGDVTFGGTLVLGGTTTVNAQDVTFGSTIDSNGTARALSVNTSGSGVTTFGGVVGGDGTVGQAGQRLASLTTNADGSVLLGATTVAATGDITFNETVTLITSPTLVGTNVTFGDDVVSDSTTNRALVVNTENSGITRFNAGVGGSTITERLASLTTNADGSTRLAGNIRTTGTQTINDALVLTTDATADATTGDINFLSTVDSDGTTRSLTVNSSGSTVFGGNVGSTSALKRLATDSAGTTTLRGSVTAQAGALASDGDIDFADAVVLTPNNSSVAITVSGQDIIFQSTVQASTDGVGQLVVNTANSGQAVFLGQVGAAAANRPASITSNADGTVIVNSGMHSTGAIALNDAATLRGDITAGSMAFGSTATVGDSTAVADLVSEGAISFSSPVTVNGSIAGGRGTGFTGTAVTFAGTVTLTGDATIDGGLGSLFFRGNVLDNTDNTHNLTLLSRQAASVNTTGGTAVTPFKFNGTIGATATTSRPRSVTIGVGQAGATAINASGVRTATASSVVFGNFDSSGNLLNTTTGTSGLFAGTGGVSVAQGDRILSTRATGLNVNSTGPVTLGDLSSLTTIDVTGSAINIRLRNGGLVDGDRPDTGSDWVAATTISNSIPPAIAAGSTGSFLYSNNTGIRPTNGGTFSTTKRFDTELVNGEFFARNALAGQFLPYDLGSFGTTGTPIATSIAGAIPRDQKEREVTTTVGVSRSMQASLIEMGLGVRAKLDMEEMIYLLAGRGIYLDDARDPRVNPDREGLPLIAMPRVPNTPAADAVAAYKNTTVIGDKQKADIQSTFNDVWLAYADNASEPSAKGFADWLCERCNSGSATAEENLVLDIMKNRVPEFFARLDVMGLSPREIAYPKRKLFQEIGPNGVEYKDLLEVMEALKACPASGASAAPAGSVRRMEQDAVTIAGAR